MALDIDSLIINIEAKSANAKDGIESFANALSALKRATQGKWQLDKIAAQLDAFNGAVERTNVRKLDKVASAIGKMGMTQGGGSGAVAQLKAVSKGTEQVAKEVTKAGKAASKTTTVFSKMFAAIKRVVVYRALRAAIKAITQGAKEGIQNLVLWEQATGNTTANANKTMSAYASMGVQLKNTLGATMMPILQSLAPILQWVAVGVMNVANSINEAIRAWQGEETYVRANTEYYKDYAASLNDSADAAKKLKNNLIGLDQLNIIGEQTSDNLPDYSQMFEEVEIDKTKAAATQAGLLAIGLAGVGTAVAKLIDWFHKKDNAIDTQMGKENAATDTVKGFSTAISLAGLAALGAGGLIGEYGDKVSETAEKVKSFPAAEPVVNTAPAMAALDGLIEDVGAAIDSFKPTIKIGVELDSGSAAATDDGLLSPEYFVGEAKANARAKAKASAVSSAVAEPDDLLSPEFFVAEAKEKARAAEKAARATTEVAVEAAESTSLYSKIAGVVNDILKTYYDFTDELKQSFVNAANSPIFRAMFSGLFSMGIGSPVPGFASGGFPTSGSLFFANEQAPELVGKIGSQTAVVNNTQIIEGITAGVYDAMVAAKGENGGDYNFNLYIDGKQVKAAVKRAEKNQGAVIATSGIVYG